MCDVKKYSMEDYITMIPKALQDNLNRSLILTKPFVDIYLQSGKRDICFVASGSSFHAAQGASYFMEEVLGCRVCVISSKEFADYRRTYVQHAFVAFISQSGRSTNTISAMQSAKMMGERTCGIVGVIDSPMAQLADVSMEYGVGEEQVEFVTLGVATLIEFFVLSALEIARAEGRLEARVYKYWHDQILCTCARIRRAQEQACVFYKKSKIKWTLLNRVVICGEGPAYAAAKEAALKFCETSGVMGCAYETEEFLHGPDMCRTQDSYIFVLGSGRDAARSKEIGEKLQKIAPHVYYYSMSELNLNQIDELLEATVYMVFFWQLCYIITETDDLWNSSKELAAFESSIGYKTNTLDF